MEDKDRKFLVVSGVTWYIFLFFCINKMNGNEYYNISNISPKICDEMVVSYLLPHLNTSCQLTSFCKVRVFPSVDYVKLEKPVKLTITSDKKIPFMGFIMQAWFGTYSISGSFKSQEGLDLMDCFEMDLNNTVIHYDGQFKTEYTLTWISPDYHIGDVNFYITVIRDNTSYWHRTKQLWVTVDLSIEKYLRTTVIKKGKKKRKKQGGGGGGDFLEDDLKARQAKPNVKAQAKHAAMKKRKN